MGSASFDSEVNTSFADFTVGQHLAGLRVDDLRVEMVFPDVRTVLGLDALARHAGAHDLRQAVDIDGIDAEPLLDFAPHFVGPRLGAEDSRRASCFPSASCPA
jgi:hypothetical protein